MLDGVDWAAVVGQLTDRGWCRIPNAVTTDVGAQIEASAPGGWCALPTGEAGQVRQAGLTCHAEISATSMDVVAMLANRVRAGIDGGRANGVPPLPPFNHAEWCRADAGQMFITPHRDPVTAGGVIAVLTIRGRTTFRVWDTDAHTDITNADAEEHPELAHGWDTEDRDLVLLRGGAWPHPESRCPIHQALSPPSGERATLTLRHNVGGFGADYFG